MQQHTTGNAKDGTHTSAGQRWRGLGLGLGIGLGVGLTLGIGAPLWASGSGDEPVAPPAPTSPAPTSPEQIAPAEIAPQTTPAPQQSDASDTSTTSNDQAHTTASSPASEPTQPTDAPGQAPRAFAPEAKLEEAWARVNATNEHHQFLTQTLAGEWTGNMEYSYLPGAPMRTATVKARGIPMFGQRFVRWDTSVEMEPGQFNQGMSTFGFHNATQRFELVWIDSSSTGAIVLTGEAVDGGSIVYRGQTVEPLSGSWRSLRAVLTPIDADSFRFEVFEQGSEASATEHQSVRILYTRTR